MSKHALIPLMLLLVLAGCGSDERTVRVANQAADRQADQNKVIAKQNEEIAQLRKKMLEAEAEFRRQLHATQQEVQNQQAEVNKQRDALEAERREIAGQRLWESRLGPVLEGLGIALVAVLVLAYCCSLAFGLRKHDAEPEVNELLVQDLVSERPMFVPMDMAVVKQLPGPAVLAEEESAET